MIKMTYADKIHAILKQNLLGRKIVIWGAGSYSQKYKDLLVPEFDRIAFFVDSDENKTDGIHIKNLKELKDNNSDYYVCVSMQKYYPEIEMKLSEMGYKAGADYCYLPRVVTEEWNQYEDAFGNRVEGNIAGAEIFFHGCNSVIKIGENVKFNNVKIYIGSDCNIQIGSNVIVNERNIELITRWYFRDKSSAVLGDNISFFGNGCLNCTYNTNFHIGSNTTIEYDYHIVSSTNKKTAIGKDCMISYEFILMSQDGHPIYDLHTGELINMTDINQDIIIGDHVWIGYRVMILKGASIGIGSIIGAQSVVTKTIPNNCIAAGSPARVLRKDIAWNQRHMESMYNIHEDYLNNTEEIE
jgi:acetyltransferase-like isoleucine patch superfamily enzyme